MVTLKFSSAVNMHVHCIFVMTACGLSTVSPRHHHHHLTRRSCCFSAVQCPGLEDAGDGGAIRRDGVVQAAGGAGRLPAVERTRSGHGYAHEPGEHPGAVSPRGQGRRLARQLLGRLEERPQAVAARARASQVVCAVCVYDCDVID